MSSQPAAVDPTAEEIRAALLEHVAAFNAHDTDRLLAGLTDDAVWTTGRDTVTGAAGLRELFDDWLWSLDPSLQLGSLVIAPPLAAAELCEELTVDGVRQSWPIAGFFTMRGERIALARIYREGTADVEADPAP